jgi:glycosyltransferase involved in cell wall biosynthesis
MDSRSSHPTAPGANRSLHAHLDAPLPSELVASSGTALFVCGWCLCPEKPVRSLSFVVGGEVQPVMAAGMPRLDVFRALHRELDPFATAGVNFDAESHDDPFLHSYRSGFWGVVRLAPAQAGDEIPIELRAELEDGGWVGTELGRVRVLGAPAAPVLAAPDPSAGPLVTIAMATYEPPLDLLERQLDSIRAQTHGNWVCVISDDCSGPETYAALEAAVDGDPRFLLSRSSRRLGFYLNFERALSLVSGECDYVAVADQDDFWHPDKLEVLLGELGDAELVYSDARIVARDGEVISETYWGHRRNNHSELLSLLVANSVTGAASLFKRDLLELTLPFPPAQFAHFHDHWIALTALARGDIAFVERPLYDYVQHGNALLGHAAANQMTSMRNRLGSLRRDGRERVGLWRMHYFVDACRLLQFATILRMRAGGQMAPAKRAALDGYLRADRSLLALGGLGLRGLRELLGRPETLGAEWMLFYAFAWRRLLSASARERPARFGRLDAVPPPALDPMPGRAAPSVATARGVSDKIAPLELSVTDDAPERVNILIPTIDLEHFFGGYIAKANLALRLAGRGARVRLVTVDPVGPLPRAWPKRLESFSGLDGLFDRVEVAFGRETGGLEVSRSDRFIATTWWTAHIARGALRALGREDERFLYLIQEYEPFTFPMGTWAALAAESYRFPHHALFSTDLLRDYFRRRAIGVYAHGTTAGEEASAAFDNAITAVEPPTAGVLAARESRRLLFYARPEPHAARNMFELGVLALSRAVEAGAFGAGWELHGIGSVGSERRIDLGSDASLGLLPRSGQDEYAGVLAGHDVGLALMYTPHPSLVPIEMASAGMLTVTNSFETKTAEAMTAISSNLITAEPGVEAIAAALVEASAGVDDFKRRERGSAVNWSRDWSESFDDALLDRVLAFLGG